MGLLKESEKIKKRKIEEENRKKKEELEKKEKGGEKKIKFNIKDLLRFQFKKRKIDEKEKAKEEKEKQGKIKVKKIKKKIIFNIILTVVVFLALTIFILNKKGIKMGMWFWMFVIIILLTTALGMVNMLLGKSIKKKIKEIIAQKPIITAEKEYKTEIDELYELIQTKKKIRYIEAMKKFSIDKKKIEHWAKILEENNLIDIHYPAFGEPELMLKKEKEGEKEKEE